MAERSFAADVPLSFDVAVPNRPTRKTMKKLETDQGERRDSAEELFKDLGI